MLLMFFISYINYWTVKGLPCFFSKMIFNLYLLFVKDCQDSSLCTSDAEVTNVRLFLCFPTDSSVLHWSFWPKKKREKLKEMPMHQCMGTGVSQVDLMLKPFEPSVCCAPCGWSQEYPVRELLSSTRRQPILIECAYFLHLSYNKMSPFL